MIDNNTRVDALLPILDDNNSFTRRTPFIQTQERDTTNDEKALIEMGFNEGEVNKVYLFLKPRNINEAIEYMTEINGIIQHDYYNNSENENQCFICKKEREHHIHYYEDNIDYSYTSNHRGFDNLNDSIILRKGRHYNDENSTTKTCLICFESFSIEIINLRCGHSCCQNCFFNYLRTEIQAAKVDKVRCFGKYCGI